MSEDMVMACQGIFLPPCIISGEAVAWPNADERYSFDFLPQIRRILCRQTGQAELARAELSTAIKMYREMEMRFWLAQAEKDLSEVEG
jgi:hypothetical protein